MFNLQGKQRQRLEEESRKTDGNKRKRCIFRSLRSFLHTSSVSQPAKAGREALPNTLLHSMLLISPKAFQISRCLTPLGAEGADDIASFLVDGSARKLRLEGTVTNVPCCTRGRVVEHVFKLKVCCTTWRPDVRSWCGVVSQDVV